MQYYVDSLKINVIFNLKNNNKIFILNFFMYKKTCIKNKHVLKDKHV